ncbi:MAG: hypothetical protein AAGA17_04250 [Actinomycetota bacterium]
MSIAASLARRPGLYRGHGDGPESGPFVCRIAVAPLPNGGVSLDYEAMSHDQGLQHEEHTLLVVGPDERDRLYVAHSESPFVTEMVATAPGSSRFRQPEPIGPFAMEIVIEAPSPGHLTYAWWWAPAGSAPVEQSRAEARLDDS